MHTIHTFLTYPCFISGRVTDSLPFCGRNKRRKLADLGGSTDQSAGGMVTSHDLLLDDDSGTELADDSLTASALDVSGTGPVTPPAQSGPRRAQQSFNNANSNARQQQHKTVPSRRKPCCAFAWHPLAMEIAVCLCDDSVVFYSFAKAKWKALVLEHQFQRNVRALQVGH